MQYGYEFIDPAGRATPATRAEALAWLQDIMSQPAERFLARVEAAADGAPYQTDLPNQDRNLRVTRLAAAEVAHA